MHTMNLNTVNSALKSAAATTKSAAETTAHALSDLVDGAHDRLSDLNVPVIRRKKSHKGLVMAIIVAVAGAGYAAMRVIKGRTPTAAVGQDKAVERDSPITLTKDDDATVADKKSTAKTPTGSAKDPASKAVTSNGVAHDVAV